MSQCVPSWDLDDDPSILRSNCNSMAPDVSMLDYQVAELTWENGQLAMHSLGPPRATVKHFTSSSPTTKYIWEKPRASGTLESIVNQATRLPENKAAIFFDSRGWFDRHRSAPAPAAASGTMSMDALVPSSHNPVDDPPSHLMESVSGPVTTGVVACVGSCTGAVATTKDDEPVLPVKRARVDRAAHEWSQCESATFGRESQQVTLDTCERDFGIGFTSTSLGSPDTSSGKPSTRATTTADDHDSVCHSISQREIGVDEKKKGNGKSSGSTKRSRAAAVHNQSERKRRDKINERMKTLQKLVPNSNKTDKASMLDEVIEYLKQLQAQISMISRMNMPYMMLSMAMQQQLQMSMMAPMGMGMGVVDHMNTLGRPNIPGISPLLHSSAFMPLSSWDGSSDRLSPPATLMDPLATFLAYQSQPMTMDAYSRMAALYQQLQQHPASSSKS